MLLFGQYPPTTGNGKREIDKLEKASKTVLPRLAEKYLETWNSSGEMKIEKKKKIHDQKNRKEEY